MKIQFVISLLAIGLAACTANPPIKPHDWALDVQTADTRQAHNSLADHYEDIAKTMDVDAAEEQRMLDGYMATPHKYGKQIHDIKARSQGMVHDFQLAAQESRKMAAYHRQLANTSVKP